MIRIENLSLTFAGQLIFDDITCTLGTRDKVGLFGLNGAGKSTLLKIIAELILPDEGYIQTSRGLKIAYLPQEVTLTSEKTILQETMSTFEVLTAAQEMVHKYEAALANDPENIEAITAYATACEALILEEPEKKQVNAHSMLLGLGFSTEQLNKPVNELSVGWKMRIVLAKLLLKKADFYLFDEPTNHLDIIAKEWFLQFLKNSPCGFMLVCHEKRFMNQLCSKILELERGKATMYNGNYDDYIKNKQSAIDRLISAHKLQQKEIQEMEATIARFRASASKAKMAQSMMKKLDAIERIEMPPTAKKMHLSFPLAHKSGKIVLTVNNVGYQFDQKKIFEHCSFTVERGAKIAIVAPNGAGKTTLLNLICKKYPLQTGKIEEGHNVFTAVFDQDQLQTLSLDKTVMENAEMASRNAPTEKIRGLLGAFLFDKDAIGKKAGVLSGGERNRLGMVRTLLQDSNFLLLDEPTNHLDIPSKEVLLEALKGYQGTMIFVSHDHEFVNELATHILELTSHKAGLYQGNYEEYLYQKSQMPPELHPVSEKNEPRENKSEIFEKPELSKEQRKQLRELEQKIAKIEAAITKIEVSFAELAYGSEAFTTAQKRLVELQKELVPLMHEWESCIK